MIEVEKVNGQKFYINPDLIKTLEANADTIVTFTDGEKILIKTPVKDIIHRIVEYRKSYNGIPEVKQ